MKSSFVAALLMVALVGPAEAGRRKAAEPPTLAERFVAAVRGFASSVAVAAASSAAAAGEAVREAPARFRAAAYEGGEGEEVVPNPAGCPPTRFCGCGVSVRKYGRPVPSLFAASSWRRFPRAECASGRVAVWGDHVAYILACHGDGTADLYDPNSGDHLTRIHRRTLPGLIVDPPADL